MWWFADNMQPGSYDHWHVCFFGIAGVSRFLLQCQAADSMSIPFEKHPSLPTCRQFAC